MMIGNFKKEKYIIQFLNQSIKKKYTPELNSKLDVDYHKDGFGLLWKNSTNNWNLYKKPYCFNKDKKIYHMSNVEKNFLYTIYILYYYYYYN